MTDVLLVLVLLGFLALCVLYVQACDRIIRSDDVGEPSAVPTGEDVR